MFVYQMAVSGTEAAKQTPFGSNQSNRSTFKRTITMKIANLFKNFKKDESGAVTVDWVVLTAAIVGLGMVVMTTVGEGITGLGDAIVDDLGARSSGYENQ